MIKLAVFGAANIIILWIHKCVRKFVNERSNAMSSPFIPCDRLDFVNQYFYMPSAGKYLILVFNI